MKRRLPAFAIPRLPFGPADVLLPGGLTAFVYGVAQVWQPAAWMVGGLIAAVLGWQLARSERKERNK